MVIHICMSQAVQWRHSLAVILDLTVQILWTHCTAKLMPIYKVFIFT